VQEVSDDHPRWRRGARREPRGAMRVDLDGRQRAPELLQRQGERTVAGADLDDGPVGAGDDVNNGLDDAAIVKKVLAELMPASMRG
jgi:hypothetical protein